MGNNKYHPFDTEELVSGLYQKLSSEGKALLNKPVYVSAFSFENPTSSKAAFGYVVREMAEFVQRTLGPLGSDMSVVVSELSLEKDGDGTYTTAARVSYTEKGLKSEDSVEPTEEPDETKYLFLSKENPELAIDMVKSSSSGKEIKYHALAPHEGYFGDVHYFSLSEVGDYNLDNFWAIPVTEGKLATWGTVVSFLNKDG